MITLIAAEQGSGMIEDCSLFIQGHPRDCNLYAHADDSHMESSGVVVEIWLVHPGHMEGVRDLARYLDQHEQDQLLQFLMRCKERRESSK